MKFNIMDIKESERIVTLKSNSITPLSPEVFRQARLRDIQNKSNMKEHIDAIENLNLFETYLTKDGKIPGYEDSDWFISDCNLCIPNSQSMSVMTTSAKENYDFSKKNVVFLHKVDFDNITSNYNLYKAFADILKHKGCNIVLIFEDINENRTIYTKVYRMCGEFND